MKKLLLLIGCLLLSSVLSLAIAKKMEPQIFPLSGETLANLKLQYDLYLPVTMASKNKAKRCKNPDKIRVIDTKVINTPQDICTDTCFQQWQEEWTVSACGTKVYVPVKFMTDSTGVTYSVSTKQVH